MGVCKIYSDCRQVDEKTMIMLKFLKKLLVIVAIVYILGIEPACAAPRNLLTEYYDALKSLDSRRAISLFSQGLNVADAVNATFEAVHAELLS